MSICGHVYGDGIGPFFFAFLSRFSLFQAVPQDTLNSLPSCHISREDGVMPSLMSLTICGANNRGSPQYFHSVRLSSLRYIVLEFIPNSLAVIFLSPEVASRVFLIRSSSTSFNGVPKGTAIVECAPFTCAD